MELIADGGSTKVDWVVLKNKIEINRFTTVGLNPAVVSEQDIKSRLLSIIEFTHFHKEVLKISFYGAGCGTPKTVCILKRLLKEVFLNAEICVVEDLLGAVYSVSHSKPSIVCILGTGSNSCYYNGKTIEESIPSLGYSIMDEASGNYFGKILLTDFFYKKMPLKLREEFENRFNLNPDFIKENLYKKASPNKYLASFAVFMFEFKDYAYIRETIKEGFDIFIDKRVLTYNEARNIPIYFIGSIAYYFRDILDESADNHQIKITDVIQRPIDGLISYHKQIN